MNPHPSLHALSHKSTTCVIPTEPPSATCVMQNQSIPTWMSDERAIAALLLSPPSVIALRPIRIEKGLSACDSVPGRSAGLATVCFFLSKSRSMAVIWAVYRRLLRLPAGKTRRPVQRPRCPCVAPSRRFSRISAILGAYSPPHPSAERASAPNEPKRANMMTMPLCSSSA